MTQIGHIIIGLIVVAAAVYLFVFVSQRLTARKVAKLMVRRQELKDIPMRDRLVNGRKMSLTGKSLKQFQNLEAIYSQLEAKGFDNVEEQANKVLFESQGINFVKANQAFKQLKQDIDLLAKDIDTVMQGLNDLEQLDHAHKTAVTELEEKYKALRKVLLAQSFSFGNALDKLEEVLGSLEDDFAEFARLTEVGDHASAADIYETLAMETNQLEERIAQIPDLYTEIDEKIPAQQQELQATYDQMTTAGFRFVEDFVPTALADIEKQRQFTLDLLQELTLKKVNDQLSAMHKQIDYIYDTFEKEYQASVDVQEKVDELREYLTHTQKQNHDLIIELDRLTQDYILNKDENGTVKNWEMMLFSVEKHLDEIQLGITNHAVVFTTLGTSLLEDHARLGMVEKEQMAMWQSLQDLPGIVKASQNKVELFVEGVRAIQRQVERQGLPGIPERYLVFFNQVTDMLSKLEQQLHAARVDVDDMQRQVSIVGSDLDNLQSETNQMIEAAALTGRLVRKANQLRQYPEVMTAVQQAQQLYNEAYNYEQAVNVLGVAIDRIEPNTTATLQQQYQQEMANADQQFQL
ncbi:selenide, water dikinase [Weissella diestrammenae]|uniref:Septation ring formation regulator EzrA n=1 Tax=Weissella diestrammenae TaxID=1162633 RepID=A0A7G9T3Z4_9LACO|nr:septation ring formation regulator EzrA [Weissella diestrammenae]MCM0583015.1 selenide, water dikinase [Weissella diestrammenae]QNN74819.1 selenide, water dikinase [Weissella diestrammenae]